MKNIRRATRKRHSAEEKVRIVLDGLPGETSIGELCHKERVAESLYYIWSEEFLETCTPDAQVAEGARVITIAPAEPAARG